ncbi:MAG: hypothetical protein R3F65_28610 [bacterium]|nr:hypothetical protein [Myxococcales bacterium]MCB9553962.1 hypothetical protein [Myxococcales bacterium]
MRTSPALLCAAALTLAACGGNRSAGVAGQADLLAEDDVVATPATTGGLPAAPGAPGPARAITPAEATQTRCLGFTPEGAAWLVVEERLPGEKGATRVVRTVAAGGSDLPAVELGRLAPDEESGDAMFGDELESRIAENLDPINAAITERALVACQAGVDLEMGAGGFRREVREMIAWPQGKPIKVTFREGSVYAAPADGAAKKLADAPDEEGAEYKLTDLWFSTATPGAVAVISDASSEQAKRVVVYIPPM